MLRKSTLYFLRQLKKNNRREWFRENKSRYDEARQDTENLVAALIPEISKFDRSLDGLQAKECIFRIYRDVRFSKDKSPYKINMGASLSPKKRAYFLPGYYIHIQPGESFLAGGVWMPPAELLNAIRQEIDYNTKEFKKIITQKKFLQYFRQLEESKLKKAPKNYPKDHPDIELLKYTSYVVVHSLSDKQLLDKGLVKHCVQVFKALLPLNEFLRRALD